MHQPCRNATVDCLQMETDAAAANPPTEGSPPTSSNSSRRLAIGIPIAAVALLVAVAASFIMWRRNNGAKRSFDDHRPSTADAFQDLKAAEKSRPPPTALNSDLGSFRSLSSRQASLAASSRQASFGGFGRIPSLGGFGRQGSSASQAGLPSLGSSAHPSLGTSSDGVRTLLPPSLVLPPFSCLPLLRFARNSGSQCKFHADVTTKGT